MIHSCAGPKRAVYCLYGSHQTMAYSTDLSTFTYTRRFLRPMGLVLG